MYAVLFAETGLSGAEISSLFAIWSFTAFALEIPSGVFADLFSRRRLLILASLVTAVGFAAWTLFPSYPAFAVGFVLWGAGTAMRSGALEALAYEELRHRGSGAGFARLLGRSRVCGTAGTLAASAAAAPVLKAWGFAAVGAASITMTLLAAALAWSLPESRPVREPGDGRSPVVVLKAGMADVRRRPVVRRSVVVVAVLSGAAALDEYLPLLAVSTGASLPLVPLLMLLAMAGMAAGEWFAERATRAVAPVLVIGAACLAGGAAAGRPAGFVLIALAFGIFYWAMTAAEARLQEEVTDEARATVTSMSGFGAEAVALLVFAGYGFGSTWTGPRSLFVMAALPYLVIALLLRRPRGDADDRGSGSE